MSAVKASCFVAAFMWSCYEVWTFVSSWPFDSLLDESATIAELSILVHVSVVSLGLVLLARIVVSWKSSHTFDVLKASVHLFARKEIVLVSALTVLPTISDQSVVTKVDEGIPIRSLIEPAMAIALVRRLLKRQKLERANPSPEFQITEDSANTIHQLRRYAIEASVQGVVGSAHSKEELDTQLDSFISCEPAPLNAVESWEVVLRLYGYPRVENHRGTPIEFGKRRSVEVLAWLGMNLERPRRSAVRTALWDVEISDATFSTVMSDIRRGLSSAITERTRAEIFPPTFTDNIDIGVRLITDFDLLRCALIEFRENPASYALLIQELNMIRDSPFAGVNYMWADLDGTTTRMVVLALDAACELASWAQSVGDIETCMAAVKAGLRVMPGHEELLEIQHSFISKRSMSQG